MTMSDLPAVGQDLVEATEALLAERLRLQGRPPDSYTTEEFLEATEELQRGTDGETVQAANPAISDLLIEEFGFAKPPAGGDTHSISQRANEILREQGLLPELGGVDPEKAKAAVRVAIMELSPEKRAELAAELGLETDGTADRAEAGALVDEAVRAGAIPETARDDYVKLVRSNPKAFGRLVRDLTAVAESPVFASREMRQEAAKLQAGRGLDVDRESLSLHMQAERRLLDEGKAKRHPISDELEYEYEDYALAVSAIENDRKLEAERAEKAAKPAEDEPWTAAAHGFGKGKA